MSCYLLSFQNAKTFFALIEFQNNGPVFLNYLRPYLGIETVSCFLLQRMARMGMDNDRKLEIAARGKELQQNRLVRWTV